MKLGLITYDARHLKTEQVALGLGQRGYRDLVFYALPFVSRPPREILFAHRPDMESGAPTQEIARALGADFIPCETPSDVPRDGADLYLILGAGLLPADFVRDTAGRVLNAHPGIIPLVRGLDAFKWAILEKMPIGNSLHYIDEQADAGTVIGIEPTPLFTTDSLESFARRHYELEISMMVGFEAYLKSPAPELEEERPARMRMGADRQAMLHDAFEAYKVQFAARR